MIFETFVVGPIETNCYLFGDETSKEVAVVDPGENGEEILRHIREKGYVLQSVLLTHGHFDHIMGMNPLLSDGQVKLFIHKDDEYKLFEPHKTLFPRFVKGSYVPKKPDGYLEEGKNIFVGDCEVEVLHTPGHTKGSCCLLTGGVMFSGDTLFYREVGRTDLEGGNWEEMKASLRKLRALEGEFKVYPGHGEPTVLSDEKINNPYMKTA
jgi:glyoxylase-like metal-dependent hydrolase (beta-lactamase superfamily II)